MVIRSACLACAAGLGISAVAVAATAEVDAAGPAAHRLYLELGDARAPLPVTGASPTQKS